MNSWAFSFDDHFHEITHWFTCTAISPSQTTLTLIKFLDEQGQQRTFRLVDLVSVKWREFGLLLGLTQNQLEGWSTQHLGNSSHCWHEVMQHWLDGVSRGYPVSWEGLYRLLKDAEYPAVARKLEVAVRNSC